MNKYGVFAYNACYPKGGVRDFICFAASLEEAIILADFISQLSYGDDWNEPEQPDFIDIANLETMNIELAFKIKECRIHVKRHLKMTLPVTFSQNGSGQGEPVYVETDYDIQRYLEEVKFEGKRHDYFTIK